MADWTDIYEMLDDVAQFASVNRQHTFLWADDPGFGFGITAFIENAEDERAQEWRISLADYKNTRFRQTSDVAGPVAQAFGSSEGKRMLLEVIVNTARKRSRSTRTRWDIIGGDGDEL